jgi:hypothetical protein
VKLLEEINKMKPSEKPPRLEKLIENPDNSFSPHRLITDGILDSERVIYLFRTYDHDGEGFWVDGGYELLSPVEEEVMLELFPFPIAENIFEGFNIDNDPDGSIQLGIISNFLKRCRIKTIFTGYLPSNGLFMGICDKMENEVNDMKTFYKPLNKDAIEFLRRKGIETYSCVLPDTLERYYIN